MPDWYADIDEALQALKDAAPTLVTDVPQLASLQPFLPLIGVTLTSVKQLQVSGMALPDAVGAVASQVTPGQPNTAALSSSAPAVPGADMTAAISAASATAASSSPEMASGTASAALNALPSSNGNGSSTPAS